MNLFFDTNVLVSGFVSRGQSFEVIKDALLRYDIYYTEALLDEVKRALSGRFSLSAESIHLAISAITRHFIQGISATAVEKVCRDSDDDRILADALANRCGLLVTGDQDLLVLKQHRGMRILSPREYWTL